MNHVLRARLVACFRAALPDLSEQQIVSSSEDDFRSWDSLRFVTLVAAIEEEFGVEMSEEIDDLMSFDEIERFVESKTGRS